MVDYSYWGVVPAPLSPMVKDVSDELVQVFGLPIQWTFGGDEARTGVDGECAVIGDHGVSEFVVRHGRIEIGSLDGAHHLTSG